MGVIVGMRGVCVADYLTPLILEFILEVLLYATRILWKVVRDRPDPALTSIPDTTLAHQAHSLV
jgi:hypothetical protein